MSDGTSWYYSLPTREVDGYDVYFFRGSFKISKKITRTVRGAHPYAISGEGFYPTIEAAQQGILDYHVKRINDFTENIKSYKVELRAYKKQFKQLKRLVKKQKAVRLITGFISIRRTNMPGDFVSKIVGNDGTTYDAPDFWVSSIHDGLSVQAFIDKNNIVISAKILGGQDGKNK